MDTFLTDNMIRNSNTILELADSYGLFACFYVKTTDLHKLLWVNRSFHKRETTFSHRVLITLLFSNGHIGQAWADDLHPRSVVTAFHQARKAAQHTNFIQSFDRLAFLEKRYPPFLLHSELNQHTHEDMTTFFVLFEKHHQQLSQTRSSLETEVTINHEHLFAARSDGAVHSSSHWRSKCSHQLQPSPIHSSTKFSTGMSAYSINELSAREMIFALEDQLSSQTYHPTELNYQEMSSPLLDLTRNRYNVLFDSEITARLLMSWLEHSSHTKDVRTLATLTIEPHEGTAGFQPIHPFGYGLTTTVLLSPTTMDKPYLQSIGHCLLMKSFTSHLSLDLPELSTNTEPLSIMKGINQLHIDPTTSDFVLLPQMMYTKEKDKTVGIARAWVKGSLHKLFPSFTGGIGPQHTVWASPACEWTIDLPMYVSVNFSKTSMGGVLNRND